MLYSNYFSGVIQDLLEKNGEQTIRAKKLRLEIEIGKHFKFLEEKFSKHPNFSEKKLKRAMIFEAQERLFSLSCNLIGQRRLKLFIDSLNNCLKLDSYDSGRILRMQVLMEKTVNFIFPSVVIRIATTIATVTLAVTVNDYYQDINVIYTFWNVSYNGLHMNLDSLTHDIFSKFYPQALFLFVLMIFSTIQILLNLPSLWWRFKVTLQMASPSYEMGMDTIDPFHVVNQYNLPRSEARHEAIWQMMVQWGVYFSYSWFFNWRLKLKHEDNSEQFNVHEILSFPSLFMSLFSSILSLSYGQFIDHNICFQYQTSGRQKALYFFSAVLNTICTSCVLIGWQTALTDICINQHMFDPCTFKFTDPGIFAIMFLLVTPLLYTIMLLPTSKRKIITMKAPCFLNDMMQQCLILGIFVGFTAFLNSYLFQFDPEFLSHVAANITGNGSYLGKF